MLEKALEEKLKLTSKVECKLQKPFLKWVGGKSQIISNIINVFPKQMENYHELFLGGGSVLFAVLSLQQKDLIQINGKIYAYDVNEPLINVYKNIQTNRDRLFEIIDNYMRVYKGLSGIEINRNPKILEEALTSKESYYYWLRNEYNRMLKKKNNLESSALFMILNKTCFRGMYREGPNGYNVPYGHYKKVPTIVTKDELDKISHMIKDVEFIHLGFEHSIKKAKEGDFVYLDPPYAPENDKSFVGYVAGGFDMKKHEELFNETKGLPEKNIAFVMSNSNVNMVTKFFADFRIEDIKARRAINAKAPGSTTTEVIISSRI